MKKGSSKGKPSAKRAMKDLPATKTRTVSGGSSVSNVMKTRHDTVKNSIGNIR